MFFFISRPDEIDSWPVFVIVLGHALSATLAPDDCCYSARTIRAQGLDKKTGHVQKGLL